MQRWVQGQVQQRAELESIREQQRVELQNTLDQQEAARELKGEDETSAVGSSSDSVVNAFVSSSKKESLMINME